MIDSLDDLFSICPKCNANIIVKYVSVSTSVMNENLQLEKDVEIFCKECGFCWKIKATGTK